METCQLRSALGGSFSHSITSPRRHFSLPRPRSRIFTSSFRERPPSVNLDCASVRQFVGGFPMPVAAARWRIAMIVAPLARCVYGREAAIGSAQTTADMTWAWHGFASRDNCSCSASARGRGEVPPYALGRSQLPFRQNSILRRLNSPSGSSCSSNRWISQSVS